MSDLNTFKTHHLEVIEFSADDFKALRDQLHNADLDEIADNLQELGEVKLFLAEPLSIAQVNRVNSDESIETALHAEAFQEEVATVSIEDSMEPLVNLRILDGIESLDWTFSTSAYHQACGEWAGKDRLFWVRETLGEKISNLAITLSRIGLGIHFEDAFRPLGVQEGLFNRRFAMTQQEHPSWSYEDVLLEAKSKTAYTPRFAAHKAGAAIDIRLRNLALGDLLDIGHSYPDGGALVKLDSPFVTQEQWQNRKLLELLAKHHGFSMYPFEDWHLCFGDATSAVVEQEKNGEIKKAVYGPIKRFDEKSGSILEIYTQEELDETFGVKELQ